jgi:glycosyltransferase involved in cell wall biosynthesis
VTLLRIGYTCHDAFPSTTTNTQQIFWTTSEIARLGHSVDVCVPAVAGGADARRVIARHYGSPGDVIPELLHFNALGGRARGGTAARAWFDLSAPWSFSRRRYDIVWTRDPLAFAVALQRRIPAVFETYRPDLATDVAFAPWRAATIGHSRRMALVGAHRFAGVIAHSKLTAEAFVRAGVAADRVLLAHNGFAPSLMEPRLSRDEARASIGLSGNAPLVVYAGHVGPHKGTDALVALAAAVPDARFAIVGVDPSSAQWLEHSAAAVGAGNIAPVPRVGLKDVARYLYAADCLVIPPTDEPLTRFRRTILPMKVFSYLAAGRPILAPALPDVEEVLADGETAVLVPADDPAAAAAALRDLLIDSDRAARLAESARRHAQQFTWEARARRIVDALTRWV